MNIEMDEIFEFMQNEMPEHTEEVWSVVDLFSDTLVNTKSAIDGKVQQLLSHNEFDKVNQYVIMSKKIVSLVKDINDYIKKYALVADDELSETTEDDEEIDNFDDTGKVNYEEYRVDENVAYSLYTNFTHKKPAAFSVDGKKYEARQWKVIFTKTCELLNDKDPDRFAEFINDSELQGKKRLYFSLESEGMLKPKKINGSNVFVETNLSANNIRTILANMLERYHIPRSSYQIYLSKDLTPLHKGNRDNKKVNSDKANEEVSP